MAKEPNAKLLDAIVEAARLGTIDDAEFEAEWKAAGGKIEDGGKLEDAPDKVLVKAWANAPKG